MLPRNLFPSRREKKSTLFFFFFARLSLLAIEGRATGAHFAVAHATPLELGVDLREAWLNGGVQRLELELVEAHAIVLYRAVRVEERHGVVRVHHGVVRRARQVQPTSHLGVRYRGEEKGERANACAHYNRDVTRTHAYKQRRAD